MAEMLTAPVPATPMTHTAPLAVRMLGRVAYAAALAEQQRLHALRVADETPDTLLLLEHEHVFTLGRNADPQHVLVSEQFLQAQGATLEHIERGGEVTYHGPGQLVAYPIIKLGLWERSLTGLVDRLEEVILQTLANFAIAGRRVPGERGIWVEDRKIASIGMAVRRWVVSHGMALNVQPDMRYFTYINPCGHARLPMTSMAQELGLAPSLALVEAAFAQHFAEVFRREATPSAPPAGG